MPTYDGTAPHHSSGCHNTSHSLHSRLLYLFVIPPIFAILKPPFYRNRKYQYKVRTTHAVASAANKRNIRLSAIQIDIFLLHDFYFTHFPSYRAGLISPAIIMQQIIFINALNWKPPRNGAIDVFNLSVKQFVASHGISSLRCIRTRNTSNQSNFHSLPPIDGSGPGVAGICPRLYASLLRAAPVGLFHSPFRICSTSLFVA